MKETYRSINKVNYIRQMLKHNDWCTGLDYMEETLLYLALEGWYDIDSTKVFNLLTATNTQWSTHRANLLRLQSLQDQPIINAVSQQVYHLRETHVRRVRRRINLTSLRDALQDFGIPNFEQLFRAQIDEDWGPNVRGLVLGYDQNVLIDTIFIKIAEWVVVLASTISQPYFCWASGTWLQGRIYQCQPSDHAWSS